MVSPPPYNVAMHLLNPVAGGVRAEQPFGPPVKPTFGVKIAPQNQGLPSGTGTYTRPAGIQYGEGFGDVTRPLPPGTTATAPTPDTDWANLFWGSLGLPSDVVNKINSIFKQYPDVTQAQVIAQQYLRTTPWYSQTFPGIAEGIKAGLFTDEQGYRGYVNDLNHLYQTYYGRSVGGAEVADWLTRGYAPDYIGRTFQGDAIAKTEGPEVQYETGAFTSEGRLSNVELQAYGREKAGIDTPLGQAVTTRLNAAIQRMHSLFQGTLANPALSLGPQGLYAPSLQGTKQNTQGPDVGA